MIRVANDVANGFTKMGGTIQYNQVVVSGCSLNKFLYDTQTKFNKLVVGLKFNQSLIAWDQV